MIVGANAITRRVCGRALVGSLVALSAKGSPPGRLNWKDENPSAPSVERRYRADAQILLLSVPLLHRRGVGGGSALWRESREASGTVLRLLEFNGYSLPARASGLNRLGFIRELIRAANDRDVESVYFGLMTSSPEESAEQARKAIESKVKEQAYTTIDGHVAADGAEATLAHFLAPATLSALDRRELMDRAGKALATEQKLPVGPVAPPEGTHSFLAAFAELLRHSDRTQAVYAYSGHLYSLRIDRAADSKATTHFRERQLIPKSASVTRISGTLRRQAGGEDIDFRVWIEEGGDRPLPLRIDYKAKPYLRLVFEAE